MGIRRSVITSAVAGLLLIPAAACSSSGNAASVGKSAKVAAATAAITPANGTTKARPDKGVTVTAGGGVLEQVTVRGGGDTVEGTLSPDKKTWHSTWTLKPGTSYTVTATAKNAAGRTTTATSNFKTLKASSTLRISDVIPMSGETVGIGMPITVTFNRPVRNEAAVERALEVRSTTPMQGAWRWISNEQAIFRTKTYWPAHSQVSLVAHLAGVRAAPGVYGTRDYTRSFKIGASHIAHVSLKTHKSKVYVDGKLAKTIPISGGMGGFDSHGNDFRTTSGIHLTMGKMPEVWMTSPNIKKGEPGYYHELVLKDVQISNSGEYMHQSPGDFECLGHRNCSHGCVRQSISGARWFYNLSYRGDVVIITGSSRQLEWNNGWGYWQMSFSKWLKGSAGDHVVTTTPLSGTSGTPASPPRAQSTPTRTAPAHA